VALDKSEVSAKGKLLLGGALAPLLSPERLDRDRDCSTITHARIFGQIRTEKLRKSSEAEAAIKQHVPVLLIRIDADPGNTYPRGSL